MLSFYRPFGMTAMFACAALAGCSNSQTVVADLPTGPAAYEAIAHAENARLTEYVIAPNDIIALRVFNEPQLTIEQIRVDDAGNINLPLIGQIKAANRTVPEISTEVASLLGQRYIRDPQVSVALVEPAKRYVAVEGEVKMPGVYEIDKNFTLLAAIARAQSTTVTAKLEQVIVFRTIDGRRAAALFNLKEIRGGTAPDPQIRDGDVVTVGYSASKGLWQDFLKASPILNSFVWLAR